MSVLLTIPVSSLCLGCYVTLNNYEGKLPFWRKSFLVKNNKQIAKIRDLNLTHVNIDITKSENLPRGFLDTLNDEKAPSGTEDGPGSRSPMAEQISAMARQQEKWNKERRNKFQECQKNYEKTFHKVSDIIHRSVGYSTDAVDEAVTVVGKMVDMFLGEPNIVLNLMNTKTQDDGYQYHCMNTTVLCLMLGKKLKLNQEQMSTLGMGALYHDIGKELLNKATLMSKNKETTLMQQHPVIGEHLASKIATFPDDALPLILHHHEREDGSGYPTGLPASEIHPLAKIIAVVDHYDNLCNARYESKRIIPHRALAYIYQLKDKYNAKVQSLLVKQMGIYPPGSIVKLSNDQLGMVISVSEEAPLLPSVLLYSDSIPKRQAEVLNLGEEENDLTITEALSPSRLSKRELNYLNPGSTIVYWADSG